MFGFEMTPEQRELKALARRFTAEAIIPVAAACDAGERHPEEVCRTAWELGLMNLVVPKSCGGAGLRVLDAVLIREELHYGCAGIASAVAANDLAAVPLLLAGSEAQQQQYLGQLTGALSFAALCATEPASGAAAQPATYRTAGSEYVLNGMQTFVANGTLASWYVALATAGASPEQHARSTCFVFPADLPGIRKRRLCNQLGQRAADVGEVIFEDVVVPRLAVIGAEGDGQRIARETFDRTRPEIGASAIGISQRACDEATRYALERRQFGQPIASFPAVQLMLADMAIALEAMRLLTYKAAWSIDHGTPASVVSRHAAAFGVDAAIRITTDAVQVFGGYGYMTEYPVEKLMRDARLLQVQGGTSEVQRIAVAQDLLGR